MIKIFVEHYHLRRYSYIPFEDRKKNLLILQKMRLKFLKTYRLLGKKIFDGHISEMMMSAVYIQAIETRVVHHWKQLKIRLYHLSMVVVKVIISLPKYKPTGT